MGPKIDHIRFQSQVVLVNKETESKVPVPISDGLTRPKQETNTLPTKFIGNQPQPAMNLRPGYPLVWQSTTCEFQWNPWDEFRFGFHFKRQKQKKKTENSKRRSTSAKPMKRNRRKPRCSEIEMNETVGHGQKAEQLMPRPDACVTLSTSLQWTMRWCSPVCTCQVLCHMIRSLLHDTFFWNARRLRVANNRS